MDPRGFHSQALDLVQRGQPVDCRSSISRAYYAVFGVAAEHLRACGFPILENATAHEQVTRHLLGSDDATVKAVGSQLADLRGMRNEPDYRLGRPETESVPTARAWVAVAGQQIRALDAAFTRPDRAKLVAAIQEKKKSGS